MLHFQPCFVSFLLFDTEQGYFFAQGAARSHRSDERQQEHASYVPLGENPPQESSKVLSFRHRPAPFGAVILSLKIVSGIHSHLPSLQTRYYQGLTDIHEILTKK
jgi:hypothetical protein